MADTTLTAHVFPSANDVEGAQPTGWGETIYEKNLSSFLLATLGVNNFVFSGALLPGSDADLTITVPAGVFWLDGRYVAADAQAITVGASVTTHLFAKLLKDGSGNVSSVAYETNTSGTAPADSTKIGTLVSDSDNITSTTDERLMGPHGVIAITSGTSWTVPAGIYRAYVEVLGAGGGGGGGGEANNTNSGGAGTGGGTTTFDTTLSATGGGAGGAGLGGTATNTGSTPGADGTGSGGQVNLPGRGSHGGAGGGGGGGDTPGHGGGRGGVGGNGGYAASIWTLTPNASITVAIGAAGTAGAGGTGGGGTTADGAAGRAGQAGVILVHY